jgi:isopenicillin-N N-acyltransferase like protein
MRRRGFLHGSLASIALASMTSGLPAQLMGAIRPNPELIPAREKTWQQLRVHGSHHDVGVAIGGAFRGETQDALTERAEWFKPLYDFASSKEGKPIVDKMLAMATKHAGSAVEELRGWAEGGGLEFRQLFVLNCKSEIQAFIDQRCGCAGCTTAAYTDEKTLIVAHNEDGHKAYQGRMFMLEAEVPGVPQVLGLVYPGIMAGNAPWVNSEGILMTTNYIPSAKVTAGIPRYFLDRMAMEATSVEEAIKIVGHPERAYAFHHIVASLPQRRAWSVEGNPEKLVTKEVKGLYLHTNHLLREEMRNEPQFEKYIKISSMPRLDSVTEDLMKNGGEGTTAEGIIRAFSSHRSKPTSVCRHPKGEVSGTTLGTALFESRVGDFQYTSPFIMDVWKGQPCLGRKATYTIG